MSARRLSAVQHVHYQEDPTGGAHTHIHTVFHPLYLYGANCIEVFILYFCTRTRAHARAYTHRDTHTRSFSPFIFARGQVALRFSSFISARTHTHTHSLSRSHTHTHTHTRREPRNKNKARKAVERKLFRSHRAPPDVFRSVDRNTDVQLRTVNAV